MPQVFIVVIVVTELLILVFGPDFHLNGKDLLSAPGIEGDVHPPVCICMVLQFEIGVIKIFRRTALPQNIGQKLLHRENSQPMGPVSFHQSCQQPADWHLPGAYLKNIQEIELRSSRLWNQWPELIQKMRKDG